MLIARHRLLSRINSARSLAARSDGQEIAEAALVLPIVFMLIMGLLWFGRALNIYTTLHRAAHEVAQAAVNPSCATCGNALTGQAAIKTNVLTPILKSAHLDPAQAGVTITTDQPLNNGQTPVEFGTVVTLTYPWAFKLNGVTCCPLTLTPLINGVTITATAAARQEF
jgi:hypothetical protein